MENYQEYITVKVRGAKIKDRNRQLALLMDLSNCILSFQNLEDCMDKVLTNVLDYLELNSGRIYLMDESGENLNLIAHKGIEVEGLEKININEGFSGKAARTQSFIAQYVSDLGDVEREQLLTKRGLKEVFCIPLISEDKVIGVINLGTSKFVKIDRKIIDYLIVIGNLIAVAIKLERLHSRSK